MLLNQPVPNASVAMARIQALREGPSVLRDRQIE
jgi:hypothetical protein